tara:strand:- start:32 stop:256 length:225 start_codon:yes stop_codon:yes gene_type:complete
MATVSNWKDHLKADEIIGAVYPGAGSIETLLIIIGIVVWIGWHILTYKSERDNLSRLSKKKYTADKYKKNVTYW